MCQFKSFIIRPANAGGFDFLHSPWTDSHEDLVRIFKLNDSADVRGQPRFARCEFRPDNIPHDLDKPELYKLLIDEARAPEWFDESMQAKVTERARNLIKSMIIDGESDILIGGESDILIGGEYILTKGARIGCVKTARVLCMLGDASIQDVRDSASIKGVWGSASIQDVRGSVKIIDDRRENKSL